MALNMKKTVDLVLFSFLIVILLSLTQNANAVNTPPPQVIISFPTPDGDNGWYTSSPVTATVSVTTAFNNLTVVAINPTGATLEQQTGIGTPVAQAFITVSGDGTHVVSCTAIDNASNTGVSRTYRIKIDTKPAIVSLTSDRAPDSNGWYNHAVVWTITALDATSGVVIIDAPIAYQGPDSATAHVTGHATDAAGNTGSATVTFSYDQTPPTTPTPISPSESDRVDLNPTFSWKSATDSSSGISSYALQIDTSSFFNSRNQIAYTGITTVSYSLTNRLSVGKWYWHVRAVDLAGNTGLWSGYISFINDRMLVSNGGVTDDRVDVGEASTVWFTAVYEYDQVVFDSSKGVLHVNGSDMAWNAYNSRWEKAYTYTEVTKQYFRVSSVTDFTYGLTVIDNAVGTKSIIWDRIDITITVSSNRINVQDTANIAWTSTYEYDRTAFTGTLSFNDTATKNVVGKYGYNVSSISDPKYGLSVFQSNAISILFDRVNITLSIADNRIDVGSKAPLSWTGIYEYDGTNFIGIVTYNNTQSTYDTVGRRGYTISSITDRNYGLAAFRSNTVYCIWDQIKIIDAGTTNNSTYVLQTETVWFRAFYDYDNIVFDSSKGKLYVNDSNMTWSTENNRWEHQFVFEVPGARNFKVSKVSDIQFNLTTINDIIGPQSIFWYIPTTFTISLTPSSSYSGFKIYVDGGLSHLNGSGISGSTVLLSYSVDTGKTWIDINSVTSDPKGSYSATWAPSPVGNYIIKAILKPNIWKERELFWNLAVTSFENQYVFSVISNSDISNLMYDSARRELIFTISGPPDTIGYSSATISEDLVPGFTDVRVHIEDNQLNYDHKFTDDSALINLTYTHNNPQTVTIRLRSPTTWWAFLAGALAFIAFIVIILEVIMGNSSRRKKLIDGAHAIIEKTKT